MEYHISTLLKTLPKMENQRFILGVDGLSRSGKTTFANELKRHLKEREIPFLVFHIDDYITARQHRYNTGFEEWYEYYRLQWDVELLKSIFFSKLRNADKLELSFYDGPSDSHTLQSVSIPPACFIIIEGVFLQRKEWRTFYDYVIYLDCPRDKRYSRESEPTQKEIEKFKNRYWTGEDYYLITEKPAEQADLVIQS